MRAGRAHLGIVSFIALVKITPQCSQNEYSIFWLILFHPLRVLHRHGVII